MPSDKTVADATKVFNSRSNARTFDIYANTPGGMPPDERKKARKEIDEGAKTLLSNLGRGQNRQGRQLRARRE